MALSREQKEAIVSELNDLLKSSKMTAFASYQGLSVSDMQTLRREAKSDGTTVKVIKNRLFRLAASSNAQLKDADLDELNGQLVYAFNAEDEVAPAKALATFAKKHAALQLSGALSAEGKVLSSDEIKALASLPSKPELIAQVVATLASPLDGTMNALSGDLHGLLDGLAAKAA